MRAWLLCLTLSCGTLYAQSPENSPPLSVEERRLVLGQLLELRACRDETTLYRDFVSRDTIQDEKEKANHQKEIELFRKELELKQREVDLEKDRAKTFEQLYKTLSKKPSIACRVFRPLTLWIHRCN